MTLQAARHSLLCSYRTGNSHIVMLLSDVLAAVLQSVITDADQLGTEIALPFL